MLTALVCEKMGWTWQEYQSQPFSFVDTLRSMFSAEAEEQNKKK